MPLKRPSEVRSERPLAARRSRGDGWEERNQQNPKELAGIFYLHSADLFLFGGGFTLQYVPSGVQLTEVEKELFCLLPSPGAA